MPRRPVFTPEWPPYSVVAHVVFWGVSALFILSCLGVYVGLISGQVAVSLFWLAIVSAFALGLAAAFSGRLYVGNQVFSRNPLVGWTARLAGLVYSALTAFVMLFAYGLLHMVP